MRIDDLADPIVAGIATDVRLTAIDDFGNRDTDMTAQLTKAKNAKPQALIARTIGPAGSIASVLANARKCCSAFTPVKTPSTEWFPTRPWW